MAPAEAFAAFNIVVQDSQKELRCVKRGSWRSPDPKHFLKWPVKESGPDVADSLQTTETTVWLLDNQSS